MQPCRKRVRDDWSSSVETPMDKLNSGQHKTEAAIIIKLKQTFVPVFLQPLED